MKNTFILFLCLASCGIRPPEQKNAGQNDMQGVIIQRDHHVHIMSGELIALWKGMGIPFSRADHFYSGIDSIFTVNGAANISLISMAYVYNSAEFGGGADNAEENIKRENDYLHQAKLKYPHRIKAYFGIDPLHPGALEEVERCRKELNLDGIKMHFNASQVYLTEASHLSKVKEIFDYASKNKLPILLHFDNSHRKFGKRDVDILADSVISNLKFLDLQIAHFGSSGGFSPKTMDVIDRFIELFKNKHPISKHRITFDISAVGLDKDADEVSKLSDTEFEQLSVYCRKLGFDRIVFGTDYPLYRSRDYLTTLKTRLKLTDDEMHELLKDK